MVPWAIHFFCPNPGEKEEIVPGREFLDSLPEKVRVMMLAVLKAVAEAPPPSFSGGGYWEAMHGDMTGYYEVRVNGPKRRHYRLFCVLERMGQDVGLGGPSIVVLTGKDKAFRTKLTSADYTEVRAVADDMRSSNPRKVST